MLYNVRYEIASSQMMEQNMDDLSAYIYKEFRMEDKDDNGEITIQQCERALHRCKQLNLTPLQIHILLGLSDCDGDGMIPYKQFSLVCKEFIDEAFKFDTMIDMEKMFKIADQEM